MHKKGQIWVESVLYTLVGLAIIGLLLAVSRPKITKTQDQFVIQQTIKALNELDNKILDIRQATGNRRIIDFQLSRGEMTFDADNDKIEWTLKGTQYLFSEPGVQAEIGNIMINTVKQANSYDILLTLDYRDENDLTLSTLGGSHTLQPARSPYKIVLENTGTNTFGDIQVDIGVQ